MAGCMDYVGLCHPYLAGPTMGLKEAVNLIIWISFAKSNLYTEGQKFCTTKSKNSYKIK